MQRNYNEGTELKLLLVWWVT